MKSKPGNLFYFDFFFLIGGVKHAVLLQRKFFEDSQPAHSCTKIKAAKESKAQEESSAFPVKGITIWKLELAYG